MTAIAGGSGPSSPPEQSTHGRGQRSRAPEHTPGARPDRISWTRVHCVQGEPLDLLTARIGHRHYAPHIHDEYAIGVTLDGLETMRYRGEKVYSGAGSVVVVEPGEAHTGGPARPEGFAYLAAYPTAELLRAADPGNAAPHFRSPIIDDPSLGEALRLAHRALRAGEDPLEAETRLLEVFGALVRRHAVPHLGSAVPGHTGAGALQIARRVAERLSDELTRPPPLAEVAADLGLSRYQVLRAFRDVMGMPPYAWLAQHRVSRARALLDAGHRPAAAATLVGFADQAHLNRWFRRVLGVTPGVYRNSVQDVPHPNAPP